MIVLDASALLELLLRTPTGERVEKRIFAETLHVPHLLDLEVLQALRRYCQKKILTTEHAAQAWGILLDLPLRRYAHWIVLPRIWQLRDHLTAYDACYVALAEALDATLLTCDHALADHRGQARVELA